MGNIEFKELDIMSVAKLSAAILAILGFIAGVLVAVLGSAASLVVGMGGTFAASLGLAAIVVLPIVAAIQGFVIGAIVAFLYNIVAGHIGGIRVRT